MLRKFLTRSFQFLYALSIIWMVLLAFLRTDPSIFANKAMLVTCVLSGGFLLLSDAAFFSKRYVSVSFVRGAMVLWLAFLIWFGWFSDSSPFIRRYFYSNDLNQLIADRLRFKVYGVVEFIILFSWYGSFMLLWWHRRRIQISNTIRNPRV